MRIVSIQKFPIINLFFVNQLLGVATIRGFGQGDEVHEEESLFSRLLWSFLLL